MFKHSKVAVGETATFEYNSPGSTHRGARTAYMYGWDGNNLEAWDFTQTALRKFNPDHMKNVSVLGNKNVAYINATVFPAGTDFAKLVVGYEKDGRGAFFDQERGTLVVVKDIIPVVQLTSTGNVITARKAGKFINLRPFDGKVQLSNNGGVGIYQTVTFEELMEQLQWVNE